MPIKRLFLFTSFLILGLNVQATTNPDDALSAEDKIKLEELEAKANQIVTKIALLKEEKKNATTKIKRKQLRADIKALKSEAKAVDAEARAVSGGIYIGTGAVILILLLVLLL